MPAWWNSITQALKADGAAKRGAPNGGGLPEWPQPTDGPALVRFTDGYAYPVESTPYPSRDELNRAAVLEEFGLTEGELSN